MKEMTIIQQLSTAADVLSISNQTYPSFAMRAGHLHGTILYDTGLLFINPYKTIVCVE